MLKKMVWVFFYLSFKLLFSVNTKYDPITNYYYLPDYQITFLQPPVDGDYEPDEEVWIGSTEVNSVAGIWAPAHFGHLNSLAQVIYRQNLINKLGTITDIFFYAVSNDNSSIDNQHVEVWMGTTGQTEFPLHPLSTHWVPVPNFTKVYEGLLRVPDTGWMVGIHIKLETPFQYNEGNLVVMMNKTGDRVSTTPMFGGYHANYSGYVSSYSNTTTFNPDLFYPNDGSTHSVYVPITKLNFSTPTNYDLIAVEIKGEQYPKMGFPAEYHITVRNRGLEEAENYTVNLMCGNTALFSVPGITLLPAHSYDFILRHLFGEEGLVQVYAEVNFPLDENIMNNTTALLPVLVIPEYAETDYIGDHDSPIFSPSIPIQLGSPLASISQTIYLADESEFGGFITHIALSAKADMAEQQLRRIELYLAETELDSFATPDDWLPYSVFTKVYERVSSLYITSELDYVFELDTPFFSSGGNLVLMVYTPIAETDFFTVYWQQQEVSQLRSLFGTNITSGVTEKPSSINQNLLTGNPDRFVIPNIRFIYDPRGLGTLSGQIFFGNIPLQDVEIKINPYQKVFTDQSGFFYLPYIQPGWINFSVSKDSYLPYTSANFFLRPNQNITIPDLNLEQRFFDLSVVEWTGPSHPSVSLPAYFKVSIKNAGTELILGDDYTLQLQLVDRHQVLLSIDGIDIKPDSTEQLIIEWVPPQETRITLIVFVSFMKDQITTNNLSESITIDVQPYNEALAFLGNPESNYFAPYPLSYSSVHPASQTIYWENEIRQYGAIDQLTYLFSDHNLYESYHPNYHLWTRIWMATTGQEVFSSELDWIPQSSFSLVYSGYIDNTEYGEYEVSLELDNPFYYNNGNLVIMMETEDNIYHQYGGTRVWQNTYTKDQRTISSNTYYHYYYPALYPALITNHSIPNLQIHFQTTDYGSISGIIQSNGAFLSEVSIWINDTKRTTLSNENGEYLLDCVDLGNYELTFSKYGYEDFILSNVQVQENANITHDIILQAKPLICVSGTILASDTGFGLEGASLQLSRYGEYSTTTDNEGFFVFPSVYGYAEYQLTVSCLGYQAQSIFPLILEDTDGDLGQITLFELINPPRFVSATIEEENIIVSWIPPLKGYSSWFTWSNGIPNWSVTGGSYDVSIGETMIAQRYTSEQLQLLGVAGGTLSKISFYDYNTVDGFFYNPPFLPEYQLRIYIGGNFSHNNAGELIYQQDLPFFSYNTWNEIELDQYVLIPEDRELWLVIHINSINMYTIGFDTQGSNSQFQNLINYDGLWENSPHGGWLIRAFAQDLVIEPENSRILEKYQVYRALTNQTSDPEQWVLIADNVSDTTFSEAITNLDSAVFYSYLVTAEYSQAQSSLPAISNQIRVTHVESLDETDLPRFSKLDNNYPNPFNPTTTISFIVSGEQKNTLTQVNIDIYNIIGQKVKNLVDRKLPPGEYQVEWAGKDNSGSVVSSGVYFYQMKTPDYTEVKKMLLLK